ncbi:MAG: hypothetical protein IPK82_38200 [Polyangiaceae bacterium]|nr:hypothetical protein [Polyangiaceae bacterium]
MIAKVARWLLLAVPIVGIAEVGAHFWFRSRPPTFSEWESIREPVLGLGHLSAPVIAAPAWASPMVRKALGDERMPLAHVAHADMDRFEHAIEVSVLGERSGEVSGWTEESKATFGKFTFRVLKNPL